MKDFGKTRSTVKPDEMVTDEFSVWIHTDIKEVNEPGTDNQAGFTGYEFNMVQYDKDEYILMMSKKNASLESQLTDTQVALTEVYELLNAQKGQVVNMAKIYAELIRKGKKTIDDVPTNLKEKVQEILEEGDN